MVAEHRRHSNEAAVQNNESGCWCEGLFSTGISSDQKLAFSELDSGNRGAGQYQTRTMASFYDSRPTIASGFSEPANLSL
jgi:hypothetical protein